MDFRMDCTADHQGIVVGNVAVVDHQGSDQEGIEVAVVAFVAAELVDEFAVVGLVAAAVDFVEPDEFVAPFVVQTVDYVAVEPAVA